MPDSYAVLTEQNDALERLAAALLERVDLEALIEEAGLDMSQVDSLTIDLDADTGGDGVLKKRCWRVCVGYGPARICYTQCTTD